MVKITSNIGRCPEIPFKLVVYPVTVQVKGHLKPVKYAVPIGIQIAVQVMHELQYLIEPVKVRLIYDAVRVKIREFYLSHTYVHGFHHVDNIYVLLIYAAVAVDILMIGDSLPDQFLVNRVYKTVAVYVRHLDVKHADA